MRAQRAFRCSCSRSRWRPSGSISTSFRARSTNIWAFSTPIRVRNGKSGSAILSGLCLPARRPPGENAETPVAFSMLLNLAAVANSENPAVLWGFLRRYAPSVSPHTHPRLDRLVHYAVAYFRDFVAPKKRYRLADDVEAAALQALSVSLATLPADSSAEAIQHALYDLARPIPRYQDLNAKGATPERPGVSNDWFNMIYQVLLGEERGPRLGSFIALYGIAETRALIARALGGELVGERAA